MKMVRHSCPLSLQPVMTEPSLPDQPQRKRRGCRAGSELTIGDQAIAGLGAGVAVSFLACPTELMKCRLQAQASVEGKPEVLPLS